MIAYKNAIGTLFFKKITHNVCDSMQNERELGEQIVARRKALGLSQTDLAVFAGCSRLLVSELENGKKTVRLDKLLAVIDVLGLELELVEVNRR